MKIILIACAALIVLASSCTNERKVMRFLASHPSVGASYCADTYPVDTTRRVPGKETIIHDTTYSDKKPDSVQCPPVKGKEVVFVKCPPAKTITITKSRVDTLYLRDNAKVAAVTAELRLKTDTLQRTKQKLKDTQDDRDTKKKWNWILGGLLVAVVGLWIFGKLLVGWLKSLALRV